MNFVLTRISGINEEETHCHVDSRVMTDERIAEKILINRIKTAKKLLSKSERKK